MPIRTALIVACLLVLPGVVLRVAPHLHLIAIRAPTAEERGGEEASGAALPTRLAQRPRLIVALSFAVEVGLHVALLLILLRSATFAFLFRAVPKTGRAGAVLFSATLIAGFLGGNDATFPFLSWRMYSGQGPESPTVYLVDGETRAGSTMRIDLGELVPAIGQRRLSHIVEQQAVRAAASDGSAESARRRSHQQLTLLALGRLYNDRHPGDPLARIRVTAANIPLAATAPPWLQQQRELISIDIDGPPR